MKEIYSTLKANGLKNHLLRGLYERNIFKP